MQPGNEAATLEQAIALFAEYNQRWSKQRFALYECETATGEFLRFLNQFPGLVTSTKAQRYEFGVDRYESQRNPAPKIFTGGSNETGSHRAGWHCIVETETCLIDWTARQYTERAPFPFIMPRLDEDEPLFYLKERFPEWHRLL